MITKLTQQQKEMIPIVRDEWLKICQTPKDINVEKIRPGINQLYSFVDLPNPMILIFDDPMECQYAANILLQFDIASKIDSKIRSKIRSDIRPRIDSEIDSKINSEIWSEIRSKINSKIWSDINSKIDSKIRSEIDSKIRSEIDSKIWSGIRSKIDSDINSKIDSKIRSEIRSKIDSKIRSEINSEIRSKIWSDIGLDIDLDINSEIISDINSKIDSEIRSKIISDINSKIWSDINSKIGSNLQYFSYLGGLSWRSAYYAEFDYYIRNGLLSKSKSLELCKTQIDMLKQGVWDIITLKNFCIISRCPKTKRDDQGKLHSIAEKACKFTSGWGIYSIHGVTFDFELWKKVSKRKLSAKQVLSIENMEQRHTAIRHYGMDEIFSELDHKLIDRSERGNELYSVKGIHPDQEVLYLKYDDISPTGRVFIKGVPDVDNQGVPIETADHAQAWSYGLTLKEYQELEVES